MGNAGGEGRGGEGQCYTYMLSLVRMMWTCSCYSLALEPCLCLLPHIKGRELEHHGHLSPGRDTPTGGLDGEGTHLLPLIQHAPRLTVDLEAGVGDTG